MEETSGRAIENRRRRWALLKAVYDLTEGKESTWVPMSAVREQAGTQGDHRDDLYYLLIEKLVEGPADADSVGLTHPGIKEAERILIDHQDTSRFRSKVVIVQGAVTGSNISVGSTRRSPAHRLGVRG